MGAWLLPAGLPAFQRPCPEPQTPLEFPTPHGCLWPFFLESAFSSLSRGCILSSVCPEQLSPPRGRPDHRVLSVHCPAPSPPPRHPCWDIRGILLVNDETPAPSDLRKMGISSSFNQRRTGLTLAAGRDPSEHPPSPRRFHGGTDLLSSGQGCRGFPHALRT